MKEGVGKYNSFHSMCQNELRLNYISNFVDAGIFGGQKLWTKWMLFFQDSFMILKRETSYFNYGNFMRKFYIQLNSVFLFLVKNGPKLLKWRDKLWFSDIYPTRTCIGVLGQSTENWNILNDLFRKFWSWVLRIRDIIFFCQKEDAIGITSRVGRG